MKIRTDFITNSSSSSFLLARKGALTDKQKEAILTFVEKNMLGERVTKDNFDQFMKDNYLREDDKRAKDVKAILDKGMDAYTGWVCFENSDDDIADLYQELWQVIEDAGPDTFQGVDTNLYY